MTGWLPSLSRSWPPLVGLLHALLHEFWRILSPRSAEPLASVPFVTRLQLALIKTIAIVSYWYGKEYESWEQGDSVLVRTGKGLRKVGRSNVDHGAKEVGSRPRLDDAAEYMKDTAMTARSIGIAVVVPTLISHDTDIEQLRKLFSCIGHQSVLPDVICIVNDGSERKFPPLSLLQSLAPTVPVRIIDIAINRGPAGARNKGVEVALRHLQQSSYVRKAIFLTDLDCLPTPTWIASGLEAIWERRAFSRRDDPLLVAGLTNSIGSSIFDLYHDIFGTLNPRVVRDLTTPKEVRPLYGPTCNLLLYTGSSEFRKNDVTIGLGPFPHFNESFVEPAMEDVDFCLQSSLENRIEFVVAKRMIVRHVFFSIADPNPSIDCQICQGVGRGLQLCRQFRKYGRWERAVRKLHPDYENWLYGSAEISSFDARGGLTDISE